MPLPMPLPLRTPQPTPLSTPPLGCSLLPSRRLRFVQISPLALRTPPTSFVQLFVLLPVWRVLSFWHAPQLTPVVCGALISRISPSGVSESTGNRRVRWGGSKGAFLSPEPAYAGFIWTCLPPLLPALNAAYTGLLSLFFYIIFSHALL